MKIIVLCQNCGTAREFGENKHYNEIQSYEISNNSDFRFEISATISGIDDVQEKNFDEDDLSIDDKKVEFRCVGCNSSITIAE